MSKRNKLISYALDFTSYLISKTKSIDQIILHGSIARDDFDENSDIDLFINTKNKNLEKQIKKFTESYHNTKKYKEWGLKGISNPISTITGDLNSKEWKNLHRAIMNTGIILYGKYKASPKKSSQYTLISFENIKPDKKRISIHRKIFGFKLNKKTYPGLLDKYNGMKIGKGAILIPIEYTKKITDYFKERKVHTHIYDLWSDENLIN